VPITWLNYNARYALALVGAGIAMVLLYVVIPLSYGFITDNLPDNLRVVPRLAPDAGYKLALRILILSIPHIVMTLAVLVVPAPPKRRLIAAALTAWPIIGQALLVLPDRPDGSTRYLLELVLLPGIAALTALAAWLVVRMRPAASFGLLPIAILLIVVRLFTISFLSYPLIMGILVGIPWLARAVAVSRATRLSPAERAAALQAQQHAIRVEQLRQWEAAYASVHGGQAPPPGTIPPTAVYPAAGGRTNTMAILAIIFGIGGGWGGILFGHIALSQIRRTGEQGHGLALAGLICGYIGTAAGLIVMIVFIVLAASGVSYLW